MKRCSHHSLLTSPFVRRTRTGNGVDFAKALVLSIYRIEDRRRGEGQAEWLLEIWEKLSTPSSPLSLFSLSFFFLFFPFLQQVSASNSASLAVKANLLFPLCLPPLSPPSLSCLPARIRFSQVQHTLFAILKHLVESPHACATEFSGQKRTRLSRFYVRLDLVSHFSVLSCLFAKIHFSALFIWMSFLLYRV